MYVDNFMYIYTIKFKYTTMEWYDFLNPNEYPENECGYCGEHCKNAYCDKQCERADED